MRHFRTLMAALTCLTLTAACTPPQFSDLNEEFSKGRLQNSQMRAQFLAATAMTTQLALANVATAIAGLASQDLKGSPVGQLNSDIQTTYQLDPAAGTGHVTGVRSGKTVLDLTFTFDRAVSGGYSTYTVHDITGAVDGYQLTLPLMTITYAPQVSPDGTPLKDSSGNPAFFAMAEASGALSANGAKVIDLPSTVLSVLYPIPENASVGRISATQDAMSFDGEVQVKNNTLLGSGQVKDAAGLPIFDLNAVGSDIQVTPIL